jgi:hypothetical protein
MSVRKLLDLLGKSSPLVTSCMIKSLRNNYYLWALFFEIYLFDTL